MKTSNRKFILFASFLVCCVSYSGAVFAETVTCPGQVAVQGSAKCSVPVGGGWVGAGICPTGGVNLNAPFTSISIINDGRSVVCHYKDFFGALAPTQLQRNFAEGTICKATSANGATCGPSNAITSCNSKIGTFPKCVGYVPSYPGYEINKTCYPLYIIGSDKYATPAACLADVNFQKSMICQNIARNTGSGPGLYPKGTSSAWVVTFSGRTVSSGKCP